MISSKPVNTTIMNVDEFIAKNYCGEVKSHQVYEASSTKLHTDGLFSEEIFGEINSTERLVKFGYINLHTTVFHPLIFRNMVGMRGLYKDIMASKTYAYFDTEIEDFVVCSKDDENAGTGFKFFVDNFPKITFKHTSSNKRDVKIDIFKKYKDLLLIKNCLVLPAGIRDLKQESDGRDSSDEINNLYKSLLSMSLAIPPMMGDHPIFNSIRYNIQLKVYEIYDYISNIVKGKRGFGSGKYMARKLAGGTRNVFSSALLEGETPDDPKYLKHDETLVPLFQAMKMFQPIMLYHLRLFFFNNIFNTETNRISVVHPKTYNLIYINITDKEKNKFLTDDGLELMIDRYIDEDRRELPITIKSTENESYYAHMVYDAGDKIYLFRNFEEFESLFNEKYPDNQITKKDVRPLTYIELMYITAYQSLRNKYMLNTRYPVIHVESIYPSKVHVASTIPSRTIEFLDIVNENGVTFPEYPVFGAQHIDAMAVHHSSLTNLVADFDGDMGNGTGLMSENANKEIEEYMNKPSSMVNARGELVASIDDKTVIPYVLLNMSKDRLHQPLDISKFRPSVARVKHHKLFLDIMPVHECILTGNSLLALLGLSTNDNISCIITEHIGEILGLSNKFIYNVKQDWFHTENDEIYAMTNFLGMEFDDIVHTAIPYGGLLFIHPKFAYKQYKIRNTDRDKQHLSIMEKYLKEYLK